MMQWNQHGSSLDRLIDVVRINHVDDVKLRELWEFLFSCE